MGRRKAARRHLQKDSSDSDSINLETTEESEVDEGKDYVVECILAEDQDAEGKLFYLLKWEGYPLLRATWEPAENIKGQSTFEEWEAQKARIEKGLAKPFDVEKFEAKLNQEKEAKALRHRRRERKRKLLDFAKSSSANKQETRHPPAEQRDSDSSSEAREVNEDLEDATDIPASVLRPPQRPAARRAMITEDQDEALGGSLYTRPRPRRRHNIPNQSDEITDDSSVDVEGKQVKEVKALRKMKPTVRKIPQTALDDNLHESESSSPRDASPQRPTQNPKQKRTRFGAEAPSRTGYLGTANRAISLSTTSSRGRGAAATRGSRRGWVSGRPVGGKINFISGSAATSGASNQPRGLATAILNSGVVDSGKPRQHFMTPSMLRKAELASRSLADRVPDIAFAGPLSKPSEYTGSRLRKKSIQSKLDESRTASDVTQGLQEGQLNARTKSANADSFQLTGDDENDMLQGDYEAQDSEMRDLPSWTPTGPRAMQEEQAQMKVSASVSTITDTRNLEAFASVPSLPRSTSYDVPQQSAQPPRLITKVKFSDYRSRRVLESFGDAISIQAIFGDEETSPILVAFKGTDKHGQEPWKCALNGLGTVSLTQICVAQDFQAQISSTQSSFLASGEITTDGNGNQTLQRVAERLRPLSGLIFRHQLFDVLIYPAKCEEWKFIDSNTNTDSDGPLLYLIFQISTDVISGISISASQELGSMIDLDRKYLQSLLNLTQNLQFERLVPTQNGACNAHNFYFLFPDKATSTASLFARWLRVCDPECRIYTNQTPGSWDFFADNPNFNIGTVLIHHSLLPSVSKIPRLSEMMEVKCQFAFWSFGDSSSVNLVKTSLGCPMTRLFPHGGAILLTPSFISSQPRRTYDLLRWFQEKLTKTTPGTWKLVAPHNCCGYIFDIALRKAHASERHHENSTPEQNSKDDSVASKGSRHCPGKFEFLNYQILDRLMRQEKMAGYPYNWDSNTPDEIESPIVYADENIDSDDEKGLVIWFALWSMLHLQLFRKFVVVGTGSSRARSKTPTNENPRLESIIGEESLSNAGAGGKNLENGPGQAIGKERSAKNLNDPELPSKGWKRNSFTAVNEPPISDLSHLRASRKSSTKLASAANLRKSIGTNIDESILYFIAITGSDKATASHWVEKFNNDAVVAVKHYAREEQEKMQLDGAQDDADPLAILDFAGTYASGPDAPIIPSIAHEDLRRAMELYHIGHGRSRSSSTGPQNYDGVDDTDTGPPIQPPSRSGVITDEDGIRRFVPRSIRSSGTVRPEINIRPGYVPPEDIEVYRNRRIIGNIYQCEHDDTTSQGRGSNPPNEGAAEARKSSILKSASNTTETDSSMNLTEGSEEIRRPALREVDVRNVEVEEPQTSAADPNFDIGETMMEWYARMYKEGKGWEHIYVKDWETCFKTLKIPIKNK